MQKLMITVVRFAMIVAAAGVVFGQEETVKARRVVTIGADAVPLKETVHLKNGKACKSFTFSVKDSGTYYVSAFFAGLKSKKINAYIDGGSLKTGLFCPENDGWRTGVVILTEGEAAIPIYFTSGEHTLTFSYDSDEVPLIDEIRLGTAPEDATINKKDFLAWTNSLKYTLLPSDYKGKKQKGAFSKEMAETAAPVDPFSSYSGYLNKPCTYTYRQTFHLPAGVYTEFFTVNPSSTGTDPVMYLYSESNPGVHSWSDDDGGGGLQSRIAVTVPSAGFYTLLVRAYNTDTYGAVDIKRNGTLIQRGAIVAGNVYYCNPHLASGLKNYFTCDPYSGPYGKDTYLAISDGFTSPVKAWNDDYGRSGGGNYDWGWFSRIKSNHANICFAFVCASAPADGKVCDLYCGARAVSESGFPNLHPDDAQQASDESFSYICWDWAGGLSEPSQASPYITPWNPTAPYTGKPYYVAGNPLASLDNFYGNVAPDGTTRPRYAGAATYSRTGATPENAVIDILGGSMGLSHAQVRKPGNGQLHGYDWESKCDAGKRMFHPRHGLTGETAYGALQYHYRQTGVALTDKAHSMGITRELTYKESRALGLTAPAPEVTLTNEEKKQLNRYLSAIPVDLRQKLSSAYSAMNKKVYEDASFRRHLSNPAAIKNDPDYKAFLNENKAIGNFALAWLFDEMIIGKNTVVLPYLFEDLTINEYGKVFDAIVREHFDNCYTPEGALIEYSPWNSCMKLAKRIIVEKFR